MSDGYRPAAASSSSSRELYLPAGARDGTPGGGRMRKKKKFLLAKRLLANKFCRTCNFKTSNGYCLLLVDKGKGPLESLIINDLSYCKDWQLDDGKRKFDVVWG